MFSHSNDEKAITRIADEALKVTVTKRINKNGNRDESIAKGYSNYFTEFDENYVSKRVNLRSPC